MSYATQEFCYYRYESIFSSNESSRFVLEASIWSRVTYAYNFWLGSFAFTADQVEVGREWRMHKFAACLLFCCLGSDVSTGIFEKKSKSNTRHSTEWMHYLNFCMSLLYVFAAQLTFYCINNYSTINSPHQTRSHYFLIGSFQKQGKSIYVYSNGVMTTNDFNATLSHTHTLLSLRFSLNFLSSVIKN